MVCKNTKQWKEYSKACFPPDGKNWGEPIFYTSKKLETSKSEKKVTT